MRFRYPCSVIALILICAACSCKKTNRQLTTSGTDTVAKKIDSVAKSRLIPATISLYGNNIPNSKDTPNKEFHTADENDDSLFYGVSRPELYAYLPKTEVSSGTSVIICPGGAYMYESFTLEGSAVAQQFALNGVTAFVLKYRIPSDSTMINKSIGPLQDAQRALQLIRQNAKTWGLNPGKVGIVGFSAGGHLAATAATHFKTAYISNPDSINLKPDFQCLVYPVISMTDSLTHLQSRDQLLGKHPSQTLIVEFSNELQVNADTPPGFLVHSVQDPIVSDKNSIYYDNVLKSYGIPEQLYLYATGGHGFGLTNPTSTVKWFDLMMTWLEGQGLVVK